MCTFRLTCILVRAAVADRHGNAMFNGSAMNFNPLAAMAGRLCVLEAERIVEPGEIPPGQVQLPGVHVHRVVEATVTDKRIERRTVRPRGEEGI